MHTTVDSVIYAVGGGHGHYIRGRTLQQRLMAEGHTALLVAKEGSAPDGAGAFGPVRWVRGGGDALEGIDAGTLYVDTFPGGWRGELEEEVLKRFAERILIARYRRYTDWDSVTDTYDKVLLPYEAERNEWQTIPDSAEFVGLIVRPDAPRWCDVPGELALVDTHRRCRPALVEVVRRCAARHGLRLRPVERLGAELRATRALVVGAGYNTFYELVLQGAPVRFFPLERRHDDQYRRAELWGKAVSGLGALDAWLADEGDAP